MRGMLFCFLLLSQQLRAQDAGKQKVNLQADNQPLQNTFLLLEQQTGCTFAYNSREIKDKLEEKFSFRETEQAFVRCTGCYYKTYRASV